MGSDGVVRIVLCIALAVVGVTRRRRLRTGRGRVAAVRRGLRLPPRWARHRRRSTGVVERGHAESRMAAARLGLRRVAAQRRTDRRELLASDDQEALVTQFGYGVLLARIPLFLFQAVQAALLPRLSRLAARGELDEFRSGLKRLMLVVLVVGVVGTSRRVRDRTVGASTSCTTPTSAGARSPCSPSRSACYMVALATAQAVIALKGHALVAVGWGIGAVSVRARHVAVERRGVPPGRNRARSRRRSRRCSASASRCGTSCATGVVPDQDSVMDAITDMPFES